MIYKNYLRFGVAFFLIFVFTSLLHLGTFSGLDTDFQVYALNSKLIFNGLRPYVDFFAHKPPLYIYLLLPGNLLGGRLVSFFAIHLLYVSLASVLVFSCGATLTKEASISRGIWAWLFFSMVTVAQFFAYGNLNGSIVYVLIDFNLVTFLLLLLAKEQIENNRDGNLVTFAAGVCGGLSFLVRFGVAPSFVFVVLLGYLLSSRKVRLKKLVILLLCYGAGFLLPLILMFVVLEVPFKQLYDHLIFFNFLKSRLRTNGIVFAQVMFRLAKSTIHLCKYSLLLVIICLCGFIRFLRYEKKKNQKLLSLKKMNQLLSNSVASWLIIYLLAELLMVSLQGIGGKNYPYFPVFAPLSLLAAMGLNYLTAHTKLSKKHITAIVGITFLLWFGASVYDSRERLALVLKYPESKLFADIKQHIKNEQDLFTLDFQAYLYLETDTLPPISRTCYVDWWWDFFGSKPQLHRKLWQQLEAKAPTVVAISVGAAIPNPADAFMSNYCEKGIYPKTYGTDTILYIRKEEPPH